MSTSDDAMNFTLRDDQAARVRIRNTILSDPLQSTPWTHFSNK